MYKSLFTCTKFENKSKNNHKIQIKLSKVETCTTDLTSYSLTQWQFWQLTLKWLSGARAQDKNKQYYCCFLFFFFLIFIQLCDSRKIHYLTREFRVKLHLKTDIALITSLRESCDIGFFYNAEFPRQIMNFPIIYIDLSLVSIWSLRSRRKTKVQRSQRS